MAIQDSELKAAPSSSGPGLVEAVWNYRWLVVAGALLAGLSGYFVSGLQPTLYEAEGRLLLTDPNRALFRDAFFSWVDPARHTRNQAEFISSGAVALRAGELMGTGSLDDQDWSFAADPVSELDLVVLRARAPSPERAVETVNAYVEAYQQRIRSELEDNVRRAVAEIEESGQELRRRIAVAEQELARQPENTALQAERDAHVAQLITLERRAEQIAVEASLYGSGVELFESPALPRSPAQPQPLRNGVIAAFLGFLLSAAGAWWRSEYARSADVRQDPAAVLGAPLLGEVPDFEAAGVQGPTPTQSAPHSMAAEAYQFILGSLRFALSEGGGKSIVLTSANPGDGKSVTAINLATAASQDGTNVVLLDSDERVRGLTRLTGVPPEPGLTDLGSGRVGVERCFHAMSSSGDGRFNFVAAGRQIDDPAGFFRTAGFRAAIQEIKNRAEFLVIDAPPLLAVSEASAIAGQVDGIVLVVKQGTPMRVLEETRERLEFIGTPVVGYVFNRSRPDRRRRGYRYGYRYGYGYTYGGPDGDGDGERPKRSRKERKASPRGQEPAVR